MEGTEKIYYLKQQSPMLHFQHADHDATLRATELKPKLDRFIVNWLKKNQKDLPPEWCMKKETEKQDGKKENGNNDAALKYQIRIFNRDGNKTYEPSRDLPYFGNMGDDTEKKKCVMSKGCIEIHIRCYLKDLLDVIDDCLPTFFLTTNFGTRQDKGFGSFVLCGNDCKPLYKRAENEDLLLKWYGGKKIYCIRYKKPISDNEKFSDINTIYKILKSGINDPVTGKNSKRTYIKSYLWEYFSSKGIDWEKKSMKHNGVAPSVYSNPHFAPTPPGPNEKYIRGLLGVGDQQQWFSSDGHGGKVIDYCKKDGRPVYKKETISIESNNNDIERIPSPLTFKIIGNAVYILPGEIDSRVPGSWFKFSNKSGRSVRLQIPLAGEFDFDDIMSGFMVKINSLEVKEEFEKRPENKRPVFIQQKCSMEVLGDKL